MPISNFRQASIALAALTEYDSLGIGCDKAGGVGGFCTSHGLLCCVEQPEQSSASAISIPAHSSHASRSRALCCDDRLRLPNSCRCRALLVSQFLLFMCCLSGAVAPSLDLPGAAKARKGDNGCCDELGCHLSASALVVSSRRPTMSTGHMTTAMVRIDSGRYRLKMP